MSLRAWTQLGIFIFGMSAIWLVNDPRPKVKRWGSVCGLIAQPFWYYTSVMNEQWGIFFSSFFYTYSWARGFYFSWLRRGLSLILRQLAARGYDAQWNVLGACHTGLPHVRRRVWVVAHLNSHGIQGMSPFPLSWLSELSRRENFRSFAEFRRESNYYGTGLCRTLHGIPRGLDRLKSLGNAIVPAIAYRVGQAIVEAEASWRQPPPA